MYQITGEARLHLFDPKRKHCDSGAKRGLTSPFFPPESRREGSRSSSGPAVITGHRPLRASAHTTPEGVSRYRSTDDLRTSEVSTASSQSGSPPQADGYPGDLNRPCAILAGPSAPERPLRPRREGESSMQSIVTLPRVGSKTSLVSLTIFGLLALLLLLALSIPRTGATTRPRPTPTSEWNCHHIFDLLVDATIHWQETIPGVQVFYWTGGGQVSSHPWPVVDGTSYPAQRLSSWMLENCRDRYTFTSAEDGFYIIKK